MNDMTTNRVRSRAVRSAAQAHLAALREERIAKRRAAGRAKPDAVAEEEVLAPNLDDTARVEEANPEDAIMDDDDDVAALPAAAAEGADDEVAVVPAKATVDQIDRDEADNATPQEGSEEAATGTEEGKAYADADQEPSDLAELPGIGPGLVWMLQNAGIDNLAQMAEADQDALRQKLGLVGELLDLDYWIASAADRASS